MTIFNKADLLNEINVLIPTNGLNQVSSLATRTALADIIDSLAPNGAVISDGLDSAIGATAIPQKLATFDNNDTSETDLYVPDAVNNRILVKESALYFISLNFNGQWPANEDLTLEIYVNGVANPITPQMIIQEGVGAADPLNMVMARRGFIVNSAMVAAGPGGQAAVEVWYSSTTGNFNFDQLDITLSLEYNQLSIGSVG